MNRRKVLIGFLCFVLLLNIVPMGSNAHERKDHDKIMLTVLFKKYEYACNSSSVQNQINALTSACYLTIDQFNSSGQKDLDALTNYGVKNIPSNISEINYSASGRNHRDYTHRGWDFSYSGEMKILWPIRQSVLRNTVGTVFDFDGNNDQQEAFCELLYYIHILGDHEDNTSYMVSNGRIISVGGRHDKEDIIHKLLDVFKVLFASQVSTHKYRGLTANLRSINSKLDSLVNSEGGINTDEKFHQHQEIVDDLIDVLSLYVPEMLKKEPFFNRVFYRDINQERVFDWLESLINAA